MENKGFITFSLAWTTKRHARILHGGVAEHVKACLKAACVDAGWELRSLTLRLASVQLQVTVGLDDSAKHVVSTLKHAGSDGLFDAFPYLRVMQHLWTRSFFAASVGTISEYEITQYIEQERRKTKQAQWQAAKKAKPRNKQTKKED
jgi:putative transposase